jgi:predicted nucleic acid-binding protein
MVVVADSSPFIALVNVGHADVLPALFGQVIIPPQVAQELASPKRPPAVRAFIAAPPPWLSLQAPASVEPIPDLHPGELAAISLARELRADLLLIDDTDARRAAAARHLPLTGTVGVLERAADQGQLDLAAAFARLKQSDFWISHKLLDARLQLHRQRHQS